MTLRVPVLCIVLCALAQSGGLTWAQENASLKQAKETLEQTGRVLEKKAEQAAAGAEHEVKDAVQIAKEKTADALEQAAAETGRGLDYAADAVEKNAGLAGETTANWMQRFGRSIAGLLRNLGSAFKRGQN